MPAVHWIRRLRQRITPNRVLLLVGQVWAVPLLILIRMARPFVIIRIDFLLSEYFGHYAGNVEMHLCERDLGINVPKRRHIDLWFNQTGVVSNRTLERMWKQHLVILPRALLAPVYRLNLAVPGGRMHRIEPTYHDRDVRNLLCQVPPHCTVTADDEVIGARTLAAMGIPAGAPIVCLNVRDAAFHPRLSFTNYRNADIMQYVLAAEALADRGYYVLRMGKKVERALPSTHARVLDYACSEFRSDFMDIYLGAKCAFAVSTSSGWDNVPGVLFRRPVLYTDVVPISQVQSWNVNTLAIFKRHWSDRLGRFLTQSEIFCLIDMGFVSSLPPFDERGVRLIANSPEDIRDAAIEMAEMQESPGRRPAPDDERRQAEFWTLYKRNLARFGLRHLHGDINIRIGARFLETAHEFREDSIDPALGCGTLSGPGGKFTSAHDAQRSPEHIHRQT